MAAIGYISFDVFDTLIKRSVARPADLFLLMERTALDSQGRHLPHGFAENRLTAQKRAAEKYGAAMRLEHIYSELQNIYGQQAKDWMDLEIQLELAGCWGNPKYVRRLQGYVKGGKNVILISDMYLPAAVIAQMLDKCGISGYKQLFVSCEYGASKRSGELFRKVLDQLKIKPGQLRHIGDGRKADFLIPMAMGIQVFAPAEKNQKKLCQKPGFISAGSAFSYRTLRASIEACSSGMTGYQKQGCSLFGPILAGYSFWLQRQLQKDEISDVYFFARDGWMLMRAFEELKCKGVTAHYLYASRRAYLVPMFWMQPEFEDVSKHIKRSDRIKLSVFLRKIGLEPASYVEQAARFGLEMEHVYEHNSFWNEPQIKAFYNDIKADVIRRSKEEYDALVVYFRGFQMPKKIAVVDVGYRGTTQYAMQKILNAAGMDVEIKGYYLSLREGSQYVRDGEIQVVQYMQDMQGKRDYCNLINRSALLFELQLFKAQGSVQRFALQGGQAKPVFEEFEYSDESGKLVDEGAIIAEYQEGALMLVQYLRKAIPFGPLPIEPDAAFWNWYRLSSSPTLEEAKLWGDYRVSNGEMMRLAHPPQMRRCLRDPLLLPRDFLHNAAWKVGYLKRVLLLPLPYGEIYKQLQKIYYKL